MIGFQIKTNVERIIIGKIKLPTLSIVIWVPNNTKKITIKKSRKDFILELISNLNGDIDNVIHAIRAHISIENHAK